MKAISFSNVINVLTVNNLLIWLKETILTVFSEYCDLMFST